MEIILGIGISGLIQWLKNKYKTNEYMTLLVLAGVAILGSLLYTGLSSTGYWDALYQILVTAGAFYAYILKRFESSTPSMV